MNILMVYPKYPDTYWSFRHALRFISKKAAIPPLGLITVAAMLPQHWNKKLTDLNVSKLQVNDIEWADYVFISAMYVQKESVNNIVALCKNKRTKMVAGGPLFTQDYKDYPEIEHFILNEAEITLQPFLNDLAAGKTPERIYQTDEYADLSLSPPADYSLLSRKDYASMNIQITRGCPFSCDFCEITALLGHKVRMKSTEQVIAELENLYQIHWRGGVSIVDDNFIGNKNQIKSSLLPAMKIWMKEHNYPFKFNTQTSINLADDQELMTLMVDAGFVSTFIGIESPVEASYQECNKFLNNKRDLLQSVKNIQQSGMQVSGGFIVGFDNDTTGIFQAQIDFIQNSGIVSAMVGLLNAPKNTKLYQRLFEEKRLTVDATGSNTDYTMNFVPKMDSDDLLNGYKSIIRNIYSTKPYYKRIRRFLLNYRNRNTKINKFNLSYLKGFLKSVFVIGILNRGRTDYWKFLLWTIFNRPGLFSDAVTLTVYGYHFRTVFGLKYKN